MATVGLPGTSASVAIAGCPTSVTCLRYADRVFLSVTQRPTFGTLIATSIEEHPDGSLECHVRVLLGERDDDFVELAARRVQSAVFKDCQLPLLLTLGMKQAMDEAMLRELVTYLETERPWSNPGNSETPPR